MNIQPDLFGHAPGIDAYGHPLASPRDPSTSHEAARKHVASGKLGRHEAIALRLVTEFPGKTYLELFALASHDEQTTLGNPTELMRRLSGLKSRKVPLLKHGPKRKCTENHSKMVTWYLFESPAA